MYWRDCVLGKVLLGGIIQLQASMNQGLIKDVKVTRGVTTGMIAWSQNPNGKLLMAYIVNRC